MGIICHMLLNESVVVFYLMGELVWLFCVCGFGSVMVVCFSVGLKVWARPVGRACFRFVLVLGFLCICRCCCNLVSYVVWEFVWGVWLLCFYYLWFCCVTGLGMMVVFWGKFLCVSCFVVLGIVVRCS